MDVRAPRSQSRTAAGSGPTIRDANVLHILALDGTVVTIKRKPVDDTFHLTIETHDRQATRSIASDIAWNPDSPEFAQIAAEMKAELLRTAGRPAN